MKKSKLSLLIPLCLILMLTIGVTYAYLTMQIIGNGVLPIEIQAGTADSLTFKLGNPINIELTKDNFAADGEDYVATSTASAILMSNDVSNHAEASYNVFLVIDQNEFNYTVDESTPEILLEITPPEESSIGEIDGLTKVGDAFDITRAQGVFKIATDHSIIADGSKMETWTAKITVVNLETSQHLNADKTLNAKLYITTTDYEDFKLAHVININPEVSNQSIKIAPVINTGTNDISKYYYGIIESGMGGTINYNPSDKNNYTFDSLSPNKEYQIYTFVQDSEGFVSNVYSTKVKTGEYEIPKIENVNYTMDSTSINVNVDATNTEGIKYYYSIDEGKNYFESDTNTYTFNNIMNNHNYQIRVKIMDINGNVSPEYVLFIER